MIVVDGRFREDDARLRRFFADLTLDGSPYSKLDRIVEGLFLGPSHYSIGLQCADLVCAITAAAVPSAPITVPTSTWNRAKKRSASGMLRIGGITNRVLHCGCS